MGSIVSGMPYFIKICSFVLNFIEANNILIFINSI